MSQRWVAFLRAINVGGHTVKMDRLRQLFVDFGLANVETFIASGNVIFDSDAEPRALERQIEQHLKRELGYAVETFLRTPAQLAAIVQYQPFGGTEADAAGLYVGFLGGAPDAAAQQRLAALRSDTDDFHTDDCELYWLCRTRISDSKISGAVLEKALGMPATLRNITTVRRLAAKYPAS